MEMDSNKTPQPGMELKVSATIAHSQEYAGLDKSGENVLCLSESVADVSQSDADISQTVADVSQSVAAELTLQGGTAELALPQVSEVNEDNPLDLHNLKVNTGPLPGLVDLQSNVNNLQQEQQRSPPPSNVRDSGALSEALQAGAQGLSPSRNRNIVRLCWTGDADHPLDRERALSLLFNSMGFQSEDIFAVSCVPGSKFDVNFQVAESLLKFWSLYKRERTTDMWRSVQARPVSSSQVKTVTIAFKHEMIRRKDVLSWLQQHCTVLSPVRRVRDIEQFWTGEWRAQVKLNVVNNVLQHLPITFFIWNERGVVSYSGQPRICYVCESTEHFASDCPIEKQRREADLNLYRMEDDDDDDYYTQYNGCGAETASCRQSVGIRL
ncbi:zinc finger CCHC domain-containing protein 3-like [Xenopus laevis]|uniref:Zinc finger CCHC domain-containing protein 3-like n=1 Tax=Xenopus laevis TaxID=8355 RepID=A0A8J0UFK9_XENLA|nr:zinc finger CCHC domain-containing protein 3-like [Xenopus laevis]XP_018101129.1 zinc finger CCHC domain-containing protein 3-like [Xenopus laevis]XP_018101130.1 zinc finger CCHC domain-containing protein 3-like [Xenopus laevis]